MAKNVGWKTITSSISGYWREATLWVLGTFVIGILLTYKLGSLTQNMFSTTEISARADASSLAAIKQNPLYAPHKILQLTWLHFHHAGPVAMRSVSLLVGALVLIGFYYLLLRWYSGRIALFGTFLLGSSSWFLHTARAATPDAMFLLLFILFASAGWLQRTRKSQLAVIVTAIAVTLLLYVPGMIWFVAPAILWQQHRIRRWLSRLPKWATALLILCCIALLAPIGLAVFHNHELYRPLLGLPEQWPRPRQLLINLAYIPVHLFWRHVTQPELWLAQLPLIGWFGAAMFIIGIYAQRYKLHLDRTWLLIYVAFVGSLLIALGGPVTLTLFLPFVYLMITSGVALLLQRWFTVFPRNPFARRVGLGLVAIAVFVSCFYQVNQYFIAWPHNTQTRAAFQQQP